MESLEVNCTFTLLITFLIDIERMECSKSTFRILDSNFSRPISELLRQKQGCLVDQVAEKSAKLEYFTTFNFLPIE